jgi:hypothetical protein
MLSAKEQADLYMVYAAVLGDDSDVKDAQNGFNEETATLIESAVVEATKCNANMKSLVLGLLGGTSMFAKGWLRKGLKKFTKALKDDGVKINGAGCIFGTKSKWKGPIISSIY